MLVLLKDPELTRNLLEYIHDTPGGRRSVSRIARTCKALSEPALNVLWKDLDSLIPLLGLMPSNLFKRPRRPGLGFLRNPDVGDWKKVIAYGDRVRKLSYNEAAGNVHPTIFPILDDCKPQDEVLPKLDSLSWKVESAEGLERSAMFLSSNLRHINVEIGTGIPQDDLINFLTQVGTENSLSSLSISTPTRLPPYLPKILQSQTSLERVGLTAPGALSPSIGRWLSSITTLKSLRLDVSDKSDGAIAAFFGNSPSSGMSSPDFVMTPDSHTSEKELSGAESLVFVNLPSQAEGFKALRHLNLSGEIGSISSFLTRIASPLQHIELALDEPEDAKEWKTLWSTLGKHFRRSLLSLQISASGTSRFHDLVRSTSRGEHTARRLPLDSMERMPNLTRLEIDLPESRVVLNSDLAHLADMCPELEVLKLCPLSRWPTVYGPPKATLAGLAPLTAKCRRLESISIPLHATGASDDTPFDTKASSQSLSSLHVGHSWVEDPLHVSILLSNLAPHLENLRWFHEKNRPGYVEAHDVGWQRVSDVLPHLQRLRLRERAQSSAVSVAKSPAKTAPPRQKPAPVAEKPKPKVEKVDRAIQAKSPSVDAGVQAKVTTRHKNISTKPYQQSVSIDATPDVVHESVDSSVQTVEAAIDARPVMISESIETEVILEPLESPPPFSSSVDHDLIEFNEKISIVGGFPEGSEHGNFTDGYLGKTAGYVARAIRAVSPPIVLRLMDMWAMFTMNTAKVVSDEMVAGLRSPIHFSPPSINTEYQ
ncbi:hypothetical protein SCHPADRAFT_816439 [Schizopora paradoxa]|uniref:F-box domain-containing protein n=1 Tax=Schizopora paradoxa TaxID=27342 RepID=A0A0H2SA46_9AGAM|nr:hypothetical protein SCHPADRAFT_816439 [Schizopora paradoxa]